MDTRIKIEVKTTTWEASKVLAIEGNDLSHCFQQLPLHAAEQGLGLLNDGRPVDYSVRMV